VLEITSHFLDREHAAAWLSARGFIREPWRSSPSLVAPSFRKFGRKALYSEGDLLAWAESRLSTLKRSTSIDAVVAALLCTGARRKRPPNEL
jgi:hypothetical protein